MVSLEFEVGLLVGSGCQFLGNLHFHSSFQYESRFQTVPYNDP